MEFAWNGVKLEWRGLDLSGGFTGAVRHRFGADSGGVFHLWIFGLISTFQLGCPRGRASRTPGSCRQNIHINRLTFQFVAELIQGSSRERRS